MTDEEILEIKQLLESKPKAHFEEYNEPVAIGEAALKSIFRSWNDKRQALDGIFLILDALRVKLGLPKEAKLQDIAKAAEDRIASKERQIEWLASKLEYACYNADGECFLPRGEKCPLGEKYIRVNPHGEYTCQGATSYGWSEVSAKEAN